MRTMNPTTDLTRDGDSFNSLGNLSQLLGVIIFTIRFFSPTVKPKSLSCHLLLTLSSMEMQSSLLFFHLQQPFLYIS